MFLKRYYETVPADNKKRLCGNVGKQLPPPVGL